MSDTTAATAGDPSASVTEETGPEFDLRISDDKVSVLLDCPEPPADPSGLAEGILEGFQRLELPRYPDLDQLHRILEKVCQRGGPLVDTPLIVGEAPVDPVDGRLEWAADYFVSGWEIDPATGSVDFWNKLDNRSVEEGDVLLRLYPEVPGTPGLNVFGNKIPVAKPARIRMRCGKGVAETEENGIRIFTADCSGRIRNTDGTLSVDDVYHIRGNINLATGNVHHTGTLQIDGDIEAGATLDVHGDIVVRGMIEPCDIKCGGSLSVGGGILGHAGHSISVGGEIQARYISEAEISAGGNVTVGNEISHSKIRTPGKVLVPNGRIAGGTTMARKGITVAEAGASGAPDTVLVSDREEEIVMLAEVWVGTTIQLGDYRTVLTTSILKPRIARRSKSKVVIYPLGEGNMPDEEPESETPDE